MVPRIVAAVRITHVAGAMLTLLSCTNEGVPCTRYSDCQPGEVCDWRTERCVSCSVSPDCGFEPICSGFCPPEPDAGPFDAGPPEPIDELDLLLVIDNSNSMVAEQALLVAELPRLVRALTTGDLDEDGVQDFAPVRSLHIGVVSSDLGAGPSVPAGEVVLSCDNGLGDDGILRTVGATTRAGCLRTYPPVFELNRPDDSDAFAADVACVATLGTGGCGFEQQLEALYKAVAPLSPAASYVPVGYVPPIFAGTTPGHGDNTNTGFIRAYSALAILVVTDEDDCSVPDYALFYRDPRFVDVALNLRCFAFPERLYPIERYVEGLLALRAYPSLLVFGGIVGIPEDLIATTAAEYDRALADPRMVPTPDPAESPPVRPLISCPTADGGNAYPAPRIVSVARELERAGAHTTMQSICAPSFRGGIDAFIGELATALPATSR